MNWLSFRAVVAIAAALAFTATSGISTAGQATGVPERFTALAVNEFGSALPGTGMRDPMSTTMAYARGLLDRGPEAYLEELKETPCIGYIRSPGNIEYDLHVAVETRLEDGGRRIELVTDRPISTRETASQARSIDYPFITIELRLNGDGEGEGTMRVAAKIREQRFKLEIEEQARAGSADGGSRPRRHDRPRRDTGRQMPTGARLVTVGLLPARFRALTPAAIALAPAEAAARVLRLGARLIHRERTAAKLMLVQLAGGCLCFLVRGHFHEREAPRSAGRHVAHDAHRFDGTELSEQFLQFRFTGLVGEISNVQLPTHTLDSLTLVQSAIRDLMDADD